MDEKKARTSMDAMMASELAHIRRMNESQKLAFVVKNLGAYEAFLAIAMSGEQGMAVNSAVDSVQTSFAGRASILNKIKSMREASILREVPGGKKSEVRLALEKDVAEEFARTLLARGKETSGR